MLICPSCKAPNEEGAARCGHCVSEIPPGTPSVAAAPPQPPHVPSEPPAAAQEPAGIPACPQCHKEFPPGSKYCDLDGVELGLTGGMTPKCTVCGALYGPETKFCPQDGAPVRPAGLHGKPADADPAAAPLSRDRLDRLIAEGYEFSLGGYFSRGWELFTRYPLGFIGFGAIVYAIFHTVVGFFVAYPLMAGFSIVALKVARNEKRDFGDFFQGFRHFSPLFFGGLLGMLFMFLGLFTCGVATVYLAAGYCLFTPLVLYYGLAGGEALKYSRKIVHRHWLEFFFIYLLLGALLFLSYFTVIGFFFALPVAACVMAAAAQDVLGLLDRPRS